MAGMHKAETQNGIQSSQMPNGLFRLRGEPHLVQVQFGPFTRPISEQEYVAAAYQPPLADLPWQRTLEQGHRHQNGKDKEPGRPS
jgi:hypothetical protein